MINRTPLVLAFVFVTGAAMAADEQKDFMLTFVVGNYVFVGKEPNNGPAYAGVARIVRKGDGLVLQRRIGGERIDVAGTVETPNPPGEGHVLRFRWTGPQRRRMTCMISGDLDNNARLACIWVRHGEVTVEPGLEAFFPTRVWPDNAPNKRFDKSTGKRN